MADRQELEGQLALDEDQIEMPELERLLEDRQAAREELLEVRRTYRAADSAAKLQLAQAQIAEGRALRVGRFRITRKPTAGRHVSFDTEPSDRLEIEAV